MSRRRSEELRLRLAREAARVLAEEGIRDYLAAKRKAMDRLNVDRAQSRRVLPNNVEIQEALGEHQRLFQSQSQPERLRELRETALQAMRLLEGFSPRLVGGVLDGSATLHAGVNLHVFADPPEAVLMFLMDQGIPVETDERRLRRHDGSYASYPVYRFLAGDVSVDITLFEDRERAHPPRSPVDGGPMPRASLAEVEALLLAEA